MPEDFGAVPWSEPFRNDAIVTESDLSGRSVRRVDLKAKTRETSKDSDRFVRGGEHALRLAAKDARSTAR
jgi:hypothetical protein